MPSIEEFKRLERLNKLALKFLRLKMWTPTFGAMLLYGLHPRLGSQEIPEDSRLLIDRRKLARIGEVARARMIVDDWVEDPTFDEEPGAVALSEATPAHFLEWAEDYYSGPVGRPPWLDYFLLLRYEPSIQDPRHIPQELVKRVIELETFLARQQSSPTGSKGLRPNKVARGSSSPIADLILRAQSNLPSEEILIAGAVMAGLLKIAQTAASGKIRVDQAGLLEVFRARKGWVRYSVKSLRKFLNKRDKGEVLRLIEKLPS